MPNSTKKQVVAGVATQRATDAAKATRGGLILHRGRVVLASHVAGAIWPPGASHGRLGRDDTKTEKYVTYNDGLVSAAVHRSPIAGMKQEDNRGCLSQNGAHRARPAGPRVAGDPPLFLRPGSRLHLCGAGGRSVAPPTLARLPAPRSSAASNRIGRRVPCHARGGPRGSWPGARVIHGPRTLPPCTTPTSPSSSRFSGTCDRVRRSSSGKTTTVPKPSSSVGPSSRPCAAGLFAKPLRRCSTPTAAGTFPALGMSCASSSSAPGRCSLNAGRNSDAVRGACLYRQISDAVVAALRGMESHGYAEPGDADSDAGALPEGAAAAVRAPRPRQPSPALGPCRRASPAATSSRRSLWICRTSAQSHAGFAPRSRLRRAGGGALRARTSN